MTRHRKKKSAGSGVSLEMFDDDILAEVLTQLACASIAKVPFSDEWLSTFSSVCLVASRFHRLAQLDAVWEPVCRRRWRLHMCEEEWIEAAKLAIEPSDAPVPTWKRQYRLREADIIKQYPVFAMGGSLNISEPFGIHFFEPRYRRLIAHAMDTDAKFVFATSRPRAGIGAYLCECHRVHMYPDGRADLYVLPSLPVFIKSTTAEHFDPHHPPLTWADVEMATMLDDAMREDLRTKLTAMRDILSGLRQPTNDDDWALGSDDDDEDGGGEEEDDDEDYVEEEDVDEEEDDREEGGE